MSDSEKELAAHKAEIGFMTGNYDTPGGVSKALYPGGKAIPMSKAGSAIKSHIDSKSDPMSTDYTGNSWLAGKGAGGGGGGGGGCAIL